MLCELALIKTDKRLKNLNDNKPIGKQIIDILTSKTIDLKQINFGEKTMKNKKYTKEIFEKMTEQEWLDMDKNGKLKEFYTGIINLIQSHRK